VAQARRVHEAGEKEASTMQVAPEIIFHDVDRSEWVHNYILGRLGHLEKMGNGITSAHVTLTQEQASNHKGNRYSLMVEVRMPPHKDLAAKKQKVIGRMDTQLPRLINDAFGAIERQVKKKRDK
jgi:ribosome-associated translation inhibitor RaiA